MRIISGKLKSRRIQAPANLPVRPTTDFAKESLFNILNNHIYFEDLKVLDLFAGTGNISFEFYSRGASSIVSIDDNFKCIKHIDSTCDKLGIENLNAIKADVFSFVKSHAGKYDVIFADPPYDHEKIGTVAELIFESDLLNEDGILIIEHPKEVNFSNHPKFTDLRNYGRVHFSFFHQNKQ